MVSVNQALKNKNICFFSQIESWSSFVRIFLWIFLLINLVACQRSSYSVNDSPTLPESVAGASDPAIVWLQNKLAKQGVHVVMMGQMYLVSIPSSLLFAEESPKLNWAAYALLNDVVCYLQKFRKVSVHVNAYAACYLSEKRTRALTLARGREIANYLWSQNVDSRLVIAQGMGDQRPISGDKSCSDSSPNSRIEIIFRRAVA